MGLKVFVRNGESIDQAVRRFRKEVFRSRAALKWPRYTGQYAKPSARRHRRAWLRKLKKWLAERARERASKRR